MTLKAICNAYRSLLQTMTTKDSLNDRHFQIRLIFCNPASDVNILILYSDKESEGFQLLISVNLVKKG